ncbi:thioesterase II family protein [Chitinophaga pinensis]|uniref:Thioesterase n=1 Tax=Chitinophaga pinensis (strain ATCC 43595 / DSM 2588 / LMG 13176 / NBRC 15968 / NCIMB 11800 / UQM 2034) TaxID=485918 RepID=A0A979G829_CHIPD|nr:thioesterase domain-containing protein [Chitinophaga pinensis]ACU62624.1 Thioesterase [Chitinophaga pinensis DSM 2588]
MEKIRLYCLPFAGGNKYSYREYEQKAPPSLRVIPLEYPGRGARSQEPLLSEINAIVNDLYQQIASETTKGTYAIYGHSMGGITAFLLTRKLIVNGMPPPVHLFITGTMGPSAKSRSEKKRHLMEKQKFIEEIKALDGLPDEILAHDELLDYFEPILRADFRATETYSYQQAAPLQLPFTVITGTEEPMTIEDIHLWQKETSFTVDFRQLPGKHFFISKYPADVLAIISEKLSVQPKSISNEI